MSWKKVHKGCLEASDPFDFAKTVRKATRCGVGWFLFNPSEVVDSQGIWTALRTSNEELVGLNLRPLKNHGLEFTCYGKRAFDDRQTEVIESVLRASLDLDVDVSEFHKLARRFPALDEAVRRWYGARTTFIPNIFVGAVFSVCLAAATGGRSDRMLMAFTARYGERVEIEGRDLIGFPCMAAIRDASEVGMRTDCKLGFRARYIKALATSLPQLGFNLVTDVMTMPEERARATLRKLSGIGDYACDIILPFPAFPVDNWSLPIVSRALGVNVDAGDAPARAMDKVRDFAKANFGSWQRYAFEYIVNSHVEAT